MGFYSNLKTISLSWLLYVLTHCKTLKVLAIFVYLHSQSQRFFVDVSFKFSNDHCRCTAYGNFAILLSLMQRVTGYLLTPKDLDFRRFFGHERPITSKNKDVTYTLPEAKRFLILSCLPCCFRKRILVQNICFAHNVRYGNSVTFRIWVTLEFLQYLDNQEPQRFDFCIECTSTDSLNIFILCNIYMHTHNTQQYTIARIRTKAWSL